MERSNKELLWRSLKKGAPPRESRCYIDFEEIDGLLQGIDYISKVDASVTKLESWQAIYTTKGELTVTTFADGAGVQAGRFASATVYFSLTTLGELRQMIAKAKAVLQAAN